MNRKDLSQVAAGAYTLLLVLFLCGLSLRLHAQSFDAYFEDRTLRLDYVFAGDSATSAIYFDKASVLPNWAGRRTRLSETFLRGNGQVIVRQHDSDSVIYVHTFSTLFQEWQATEEATQVAKAFESTYLVPMPKGPVDITIRLTDFHDQVSASLTHTIDPSDILIRPIPADTICVRDLMVSAPLSEAVDIVMVAEGFTAEEMDKFYADAQRATEAIFSHEPFASLKDKFNVRALGIPSADSGPCIPREGQWKQSAAMTHYDTFYSDRYLMTDQIHRLYDLVGATPCEQIILLVNSPTYGGGGIYNQVTLSTTDHPTFLQVLVHEFGHGYAGLGDEYFYDDQYTTMYPADTEPWEPNLTTLADFASKWADMVPEGVAIPTPAADIPDFRKASTAEEWAAINAAVEKVGVYEGGGYQSKGVYRPAQECRMKINEVEHFCPVCARAIERITEFLTNGGE